MKSIRFIVPLLILLFFASSSYSQTSTTPPSPSSIVTNSFTALKIIKVAANELNVSPDVLWTEYQNGVCCIHLIDEKTGTYRVVAGGGVVVYVESIF